MTNVLPFPGTSLAQAAGWCTACDLCHTIPGGGRQLLYGTGPSDARIMLVGEAPGYQESREGIPFVGESGQLLNKLIGRAGLRRENVFVTNAVRCQPPAPNKKQKKPNAAQIKACRQHLRREIEAINPKMIVALGNTPLVALTGQSGITKLRGQMQKLTVSKHSPFNGLPDIPVMPTYHPAYALREPVHEKEITLDILTGMRTLDGGFAEVYCGYNLYQEFGSPDSTQPLWSFDIETNARELGDPELAIWFLSIDDGKNIVLFQSLYIQDAVDILARYVNAGGTLVGQNSSAYDRMAIKQIYDVNLRCHDTQLLCHLLDEEAPTNLQMQAIRELGVAPWKDGFDKAFWENWASASDEQKYSSYYYNAQDTRYTRMIFERYWSVADDRIKRLYVAHNLPVSRALASVQAHGVWLSQENTDASVSELEVEQRISLLHLQDLTRPDINPGSHQQVREVLFSDLMLPVQKTTGGGDPSTDAETLKRLQSFNLGGPTLDAILKYRKSSKLLSYLKSYRELRPPSGWIHPSYSMTTAVNLRTNCFGPNLQNVPRDKRVRSAVAAPPGWVLIEADYRMLELFQAAELTGPQCALYQALARGDDVHIIMASRLTGKLLVDVTKAERSDAKPANFAFLYYADEPTYIRQSLVDFDRIVSMEEAAIAKAAFRAWGVEPWWQRTIEELEATGEVRSIFGAVRRLPAIRSRDKYNQLEAKREAINFTDASVACHIAELAMAQSVGRGLHVGGFIHDALLVYAREDNAKEVAAMLQYDMEIVVPQLIEEIFSYHYSLPLKAEVTIGRHWGDKA